MKSRPICVFVVVLVAALACNLPATPTVTNVVSPESDATPSVEIVSPGTNVRGPGFASYPEITVSLPSSYEGHGLPVDVAGLGNVDRFSLSDAQLALLSSVGFVVAPAEWYEFFQLYENARYEEVPVFVTTDSVFHVYHLLFDKILRDLEREHFEPDIRALTSACLGSAQSLSQQLQGTELEELARRVVAYFAVANSLIDPDADIPVEVADLAGQELSQVEAHAGLLPSPIFSADCPVSCDPCDTEPPPECLDQPCMCEDYSQYVPRGHYTRSEQLERYFRTMMWYGRMNLRLQKPDETRMALLITYILRNTEVNGQPGSEVWGRVYDPTVFIVGKADDLGFHEYGALWDAVYGPDAAPTSIADDALLTTFIASARQLPPPQINSMWVYIWEDKEQVTQGFRFMGQRFVLDAYIFDELTWREVGTFETPRMLPMGLDVMAALGSDEAYSVLTELGETSYANYPEQMEKLRDEVTGLGLDSWTQNLYWSWLYSLQPLLEPKGPEFPEFMRTAAWTRRDLQAALGSWTELKHDTILYAKQSMAEMGGGPPPEPPHGWVEPNAEAYARLLALTRMTEEGLARRDLLSAGPESNLTRLDDLLSFLLTVVEKELNGEVLSFDDYERIKFFGGELEALTLAAADQEGDGMPFFEQQEQAALVADVATDPTGQVLEEATGRIFEIYVAVPNGSGGQHLAKGGVYSYYEFPWPMSDRLTDEAWRDMLETGSAPDLPAWTDSFVAD
jgi:hypothetical protein